MLRDIFCPTALRQLWSSLTLQERMKSPLSSNCAVSMSVTNMECVLQILPFVNFIFGNRSEFEPVQCFFVGERLQTMSVDVPKVPKEIVKVCNNLEGVTLTKPLKARCKLIHFSYNDF